MQIIPLQPVANQTVGAILANQTCTITVYQKRYGLFLDLYVGPALIVAGCLCEDRNRLVRSLYLGFIGDLVFIDNQGKTDPVYTGLGSRYSLAYLELSDLNGQG